MGKLIKFFVLAVIAVMLLGSCTGNASDPISDFILIEDIMVLFDKSQDVPSLWVEGADGYKVAEKDSDEIALEDGKTGVIQAGSRWTSIPSVENPERIIHDLKVKINGNPHTLYLEDIIESGSQVTYKIKLDGREINPAGFEHK